MSTIDGRLRDLDIALPDVMPPVVDGYVPAFAPFIRSGDQIHLSGRLAKEDGKPKYSASVASMRAVPSVWRRCHSARASKLT